MSSPSLQHCPRTHAGNACRPRSQQQHRLYCVHSASLNFEDGSVFMTSWHFLTGCRNHSCSLLLQISSVLRQANFVRNIGALRRAWARSTSRSREAFCLTHVRRSLQHISGLRLQTVPAIRPVAGHSILLVCKIHAGCGAQHVILQYSGTCSAGALIALPNHTVCGRHAIASRLAYMVVVRCCRSGRHAVSADDYGCLEACNPPLNTLQGCL